jgi:signal-transduction protein with cAMP-binding, CBS, and nucleotidyltransferase domain
MHVWRAENSTFLETLQRRHDMATVNDLLSAKTDGSRYAIRANETIYRAIRLMADRNIGAVLVVEKGIVIGIFTERDYIMRVEVEGRSPKDTLLRDVMTDRMYTVATHTSVEQCLALMMLHHIRHLPIVEDGNLLGIISMRDAVDAMLDEHRSEIQGLDDYTLDSGFRG